ncbi:MAG: winged helix-turn-helix transcriptional regulator [Planctomycetia bacterium]|nr:winged helix-turn-helix transcriptional regulator [Planctomycetia bacterium]
MAALKPDQLDAVARVFRVLAEPTRLAILQELRRKPRTVNELVESLGAKQANVSKQLGILFDAGLLDRERSGNCVVYSIREPAIFELCEIVCGKLQRNARRQYATFAGKPRR